MVEYCRSFFFMERSQAGVRWGRQCRLSWPGQHDLWRIGVCMSAPPVSSHAPVPQGKAPWSGEESTAPKITINGCCLEKWLPGCAGHIASEGRSYMCFMHQKLKQRSHYARIWPRYNGKTTFVGKRHSGATYKRINSPVVLKSAVELVRARTSRDLGKIS
jgi:hypothetical protein